MANETPRAVSIELPFLPPPELGGNTRAHNLARYRKSKAMQEAVVLRLNLLDEEPPRFQRVTILYDVYFCGRPPDEDNLLMGMKSCLDAIRKYGVIPDDDPAHIQSITATYHRVPHRDQVKVRVTVTEVA